MGYSHNCGYCGRYNGGTAELHLTTISHYYNLYKFFIKRLEIKHCDMNEEHAEKYRRLVLNQSHKIAYEDNNLKYSCHNTIVINNKSTWCMKPYIMPLEMIKHEHKCYDFEEEPPTTIMISRLDLPSYTCNKCGQVFKDTPSGSYKGLYALNNHKKSCERLHLKKLKRELKEKFTDFLKNTTLSIEDLKNLIEKGFN